MGRETGRNKRVAGKGVMHKVRPFAKTLSCAARPRCWEIDNRCSNCGPDLQINCGLGHDLREEVLIAKTGCAPG